MIKFLEEEHLLKLVPSEGNTNITVTGTGSTLDIDADGALTIDSATSIAVGNTANKPIDINASTLAIDTIDNTNITVGGNEKTLDIDASGALTIDSATSISIGNADDKPIDIEASTLAIDASGNTNITVTGTGSTLDIDELYFTKKNILKI